MGKNISPDKLRDMIRSILPSTCGSGPRAEKAQRKRGVRRGVRADLRIVDTETTHVDLCRDSYVHDIVISRRGGDKLNHFMRWCHAITKGMTTEEALSYVRSILPPSVIGDHAYFHWELERKPRRRWSSAFDYVPHERRQQSAYDSLRFRLRRALSEDPAGAGVLNRMIKARTAFDQPRRLLHGLHDVDEFVRELVYGKCRSVELRCLEQLIEQVEKGGLAAALQSYWVRSPAQSCSRP